MLDLPAQAVCSQCGHELIPYSVCYEGGELRAAFYPCTYHPQATMRLYLSGEFGRRAAAAAIAQADAPLTNPERGDK